MMRLMNLTVRVRRGQKPSFEGLCELSSMRKLVDFRAGKQIGADTVNIA
jgi:hypothetical protein